MLSHHPCSHGPLLVYHRALEWIEERTAQLLRHVQQSLMVDEKARRPVRHLHDRWYAIADGTERYLVDEAMLMQVTAELGAELVDPIKTTVVQNLRSMTTWVLRKR